MYLPRWHPLYCIFFVSLASFSAVGLRIIGVGWCRIATSEAYIWDSAPCAPCPCIICLRCQIFFLCEDEARDGAYGPPEMSGRQISVCVLARRRVLLRLNRIQNLQQPCWVGCREPRKSFFGATDQISFLPLLRGE
ncbi:hypothetical protein B0T12DRAFT_140369 [Alternaria alternata]|nr:hypothetical protein B0T12DRAFT_140369 [Alternaria alternata]